MKITKIIILILSVVSCTQNKNNHKKDELVFANYRDIRNLNPHLYSGEMWAQEMLYDTLVSVENDGIKPSLAESWEISPDGKTYTFDIRNGVKFSNGDDLDAYVIEKNFDAVWDNKAKHMWLGALTLVTNYKALDSDTLRCSCQSLIIRY